MTQVECGYLAAMKMRLAQLKPGTIWRDQKGEQVYIDSCSTNLLRGCNTFQYVDYYDSFGLKTLSKDQFLARFRYLGKARLLRSELASDRNLLKD